MARALIGTSGWHYGSWRGLFFPAGLPVKSQLQYYASQFQTAELNGVFYRTPTRDAVKSWKTRPAPNRLHLESFEVHRALENILAKSVNSLELLRSYLAARPQGRAHPV